MAKESAVEKPPAFSDAEKAYISGQRLLRIATISAKPTVDVAPVAFRFDGQRFHIGGLDLKSTFKYRNIKDNGHVALVIDDLKTIDPWRPRGVKIHGTGEIATRPDGREVIEVTPTRKWSWGIDRA